MRASLLLLAIACARSGRDYVVHRAKGAIEIDGVLAESAWDGADKAGPFVRSLDGKPATAATEARLLWDDDYLYVAFLAEDANVSGAFFKDDEKLYTSNVVEIFLDPGADGSHYDEIEVAPTNALFGGSMTAVERLRFRPDVVILSSYDLAYGYRPFVAGAATVFIYHSSFHSEWTRRLAQRRGRVVVGVAA